MHVSTQMNWRLPAMSARMGWRLPALEDICWRHPALTLSRGRHHMLIVAVVMSDRWAQTRCLRPSGIAAAFCISCVAYLFGYATGRIVGMGHSRICWSDGGRRDADCDGAKAPRGGARGRKAERVRAASQDGIRNSRCVGGDYDPRCFWQVGRQGHFWLKKGRDCTWWAHLIFDWMQLLDVHWCRRFLRGLTCDTNIYVQLVHVRKKLFMYL